MVSATTGSSTSNDGPYRTRIIIEPKLKFNLEQRFAGWRTTGGRCTLMVRNEAYRQSTGSFPSSGACPKSRLLVSNCLKIPHSPMLSKISLLELSRVTLSVLGHQVPPCVCMFAFLGGHSTFHRENASYYQAKQAAAT